MAAPFADADLAARIELAHVALLREAVDAIATSRPERDVAAIDCAAGLAVFTGPGSPLDKLFGLGFASGDAPAVPAAACLAAVEDEARRRGVPLQVEVASLADPGVLQLLAERDYELVGIENVCGLALADQAFSGPADDLRIDVGDARREEWLDVVANGFAQPDTRGVPSHESFDSALLRDVIADFTAGAGMLRYNAWLGDDPQLAGGASLRLIDDVALLCGAATRPDRRGRGVQTGLLARRLEEARQAGCDVATVTTQPGSTSHGNMHRRGFELLYVRAVLTKDPSAA